MHFILSYLNLGVFMPKYAFIKGTSFSGCGNLNMQACPLLNKVPMQQSKINAPMYILLNDKAVKEIDELCRHCAGFGKK
jgi:hypothetical protein